MAQWGARVAGAAGAISHGRSGDPVERLGLAGVLARQGGEHFGVDVHPLLDGAIPRNDEAAFALGLVGQQRVLLEAHKAPRPAQRAGRAGVAPRGARRPAAQGSRSGSGSGSWSAASASANHGRQPPFRGHHGGRGGGGGLLRKLRRGGRRRTLLVLLILCCFVVLVEVTFLVVIFVVILVPVVLVVVVKAHGVRFVERAAQHLGRQEGLQLEHVCAGADLHGHFAGHGVGDLSGSQPAVYEKLGSDHACRVRCARSRQVCDSAAAAQALSGGQALLALGAGLHQRVPSACACVQQVQVVEERGLRPDAAEQQQVAAAAHGAAGVPCSGAGGGPAEAGRSRRGPRVAQGVQHVDVVAVRGVAAEAAEHPYLGADHAGAVTSARSRVGRPWRHGDREGRPRPHRGPLQQRRFVRSRARPGSWHTACGHGRPRQAAHPHVAQGLLALPPEQQKHLLATHGHQRVVTTRRRQHARHDATWRRLLLLLLRRKRQQLVVACASSSSSSSDLHTCRLVRCRIVAFV